MSQLKAPSFALQLVLIIISAIVQLFLLRLGFVIDVFLSALLVISLIGAFEAVLIGGLLGYLLLFGPLLRLELLYLLVIPLVIGYFGRQLLGKNIATFCGITGLGLAVFYILIDASAIFSAPLVIVGNIAFSLLWVVGIYFYISSRRSIAN